MTLPGAVTKREVRTLNLGLKMKIEKKLIIIGRKTALERLYIEKGGKYEGKSKKYFS